MAGCSYTLAILLRDGSLRHFQLMLHSVLRQSVLPAEVLYIGLPSTASAIAQYATRNPLPIDVPQQLVWCLAASEDSALEWSMLQRIADHASSDVVLITESDVVLEERFAEVHTALQTESTLVTSFPAILSPLLSSQLDEAALDRGEPFVRWWRVAVDGIFGQSRHVWRLVPLPKWLESRLNLELSRSALSAKKATLERLLTLRHWMEGHSTRSLFAQASVEYVRATHQARHARLTEHRSEVLVLVPSSAPQWKAVPQIATVEIRPVLRRHRLN